MPLLNTNLLLKAMINGSERYNNQNQNSAFSITFFNFSYDWKAAGKARSNSLREHAKALLNENSPSESGSRENTEKQDNISKETLILAAALLQTSSVDLIAAISRVTCRKANTPSSEAEKKASNNIQAYINLNRPTTKNSYRIKFVNSVKHDLKPYLNNGKNSSEIRWNLGSLSFETPDDKALYKNLCDKLNGGKEPQENNATPEKLATETDVELSARKT